MPERAMSTVIRVPLDELGEPQPLLHPGLAAAGVGIRVVGADRVPWHPGLDESVLFALSVSDPHVECRLVDADGGLVARSGLAGRNGNEQLLYFVRSMRVPGADGTDLIVDTSRATALEIRLPVRFRRRSRDRVQALTQAIADHLPERAAEIRRSTGSMYRCVPTIVGEADELPLGASRFNGSPDLPADMGWPMWRGPSTDGEPTGARGEGPLTFLAQIDLSALPPLRSSMLPTSGWLLLFADLERFTPDDQAAHRVVHLPAGTPLERRDPPSAHRHYASTGGAEPGSGPVAGRGRPAAVGFDVVPAIPYDDIRRLLQEAPEPGRSELEDLTLDFLGRDWHQLLGHPISVHEDVLASFQATWLSRTPAHDRGAELDTASESSRQDWQLLFTLWDDGPVQDLGGGVLYVGIRTEDLLLRRFDRTVAVFQH